MINSHEFQSNGNAFSLLWFDIRVFYVRISNFSFDSSTPDHLTLTHTPLDPDTILQVNNLRCSIDSEGMSCTLRRDHQKSEEATFVSTDSIRFTGSVKFEVFDKDNLFISGLLEMPGPNNNNHTGRMWAMNCESVMNGGACFLKGKQESLLPTVEVYVAGCFLGTPVILTKTFQVGCRKKHMKGVMDSIPETDTFATRHDLQVSEYKHESEEECDSLYWRETEDVEGGNGELSWFNAGVRVGVGIGLGICLGIGVGVGLLVRTYQTTTRTFKRRLG